MEDTVKSEHDCRQLVKDLRKQLVEVKREKEEQITKLDEDVAHCKDQLQELKACTGLLNKYIKKQSDVKVQCSQRQQQNKESDLYNERERLKQELAEEKRAHAEIENYMYLKKHIE
ncbi:PREDICTED: IQ domain-containing protein G-like, partial [Amphimedon queenslandica]